MPSDNERLVTGLPAGQPATVAVVYTGNLGYKSSGSVRYSDRKFKALGKICVCSSSSIHQCNEVKTPNYFPM